MPQPQQKNDEKLTIKCKMGCSRVVQNNDFRQQLKKVIDKKYFCHTSTMRRGFKSTPVIQLIFHAFIKKNSILNQKSSPKQALNPNRLPIDLP
jgi:hypothetical protein